MAKRLISLICIVLVLGIAGSANADYIASGNVTGTASSSYNSTGWPIEATCNEAGLDTATKLVHSWISGTPTAWLCLSGGDSNPSASGATGYCWAHYQFDQTYMLGEMWVWNCGTCSAVPGDRSFKTNFGSVFHRRDELDCTRRRYDDVCPGRSGTSQL